MSQAHLDPARRSDDQSAHYEALREETVLAAIGRDELAPAALNTFAIARPIPLAPPVIKAT